MRRLRGVVAAVFGMAAVAIADAQSEPNVLRWILQSTEGPRNDMFGAWLISGAPTPLNVSVNAPFAAQMASSSGADCSGVSPLGATPWSGQLRPGEVAYFCITPTGGGSLRLLATGTYIGVPTSVNESPRLLNAIAISDSFQVKEFWQLDPSIAATVGALSGFLIATLTFYVQKRIETRFDALKTRREFERQVATGLFNEMTRNRELLFAVIQAAARPTKVQTGAYNNIDKALKAFLAVGRRGSYFKKLDALYRGPISAYNDGIDTGAKNIIERAQTALQAMEDMD